MWIFCERENLLYHSCMLTFCIFSAPPDSPLKHLLSKVQITSRWPNPQIAFLYLLHLSLLQDSVKVALLREALHYPNGIHCWLSLCSPATPLSPLLAVLSYGTCEYSLPQ